MYLLPKFLVNNLIFYSFFQIPRLTLNTVFWFSLLRRLAHDSQLGCGASSLTYSSDYLPSGNDVNISYHIVELRLRMQFVIILRHFPWHEANHILHLFSS